MCTDKIISLFHSILFVGPHGAIKIYLKIRDNFIIPGLKYHPRSYIEGCHIYQLLRNKTPVRQLQQRINLHYRAVPRLSMDLKVMIKSFQGHKFILCKTDEITNYFITVHIVQG